MFKLILLIAVAILSIEAMKKDIDLMKREMDTLEKDLENAHLTAASKRSLNDLTTDELIDELKNEIDAITKSNKDAFQSRFENIIQPKSVDEDALWKESLQIMAKDLLKKATFKDDNECADKRSDCQTLQPYCKTHRDKLEDICAKTCKYCTDCKNKLASCERLAKMNQCDAQRERMSEFCPRSCGLCNVPAPPKCSSTTHGCCWDKETRKLNKDGSNCPVCNDHYKYVCKTFQNDCSSLRTAGDFMRRYCPRICNLCGTDCLDSPSHSFYCPFWKGDLNWCENQKDTMRHYCPKTCGFC